jgi:hypothetical protein
MIVTAPRPKERERKPKKKKWGELLDNKSKSKENSAKIQISDSIF